MPRNLQQAPSRDVAGPSWYPRLHVGLVSLNVERSHLPLRRRIAGLRYSAHSARRCATVHPATPSRSAICLWVSPIRASWLARLRRSCVVCCCCSLVLAILMLAHLRFALIWAAPEAAQAAHHFTTASPLSRRALAIDAQDGALRDHSRIAIHHSGSLRHATKIRTD